MQISQGVAQAVQTLNNVAGDAALCQQLVTELVTHLGGAAIGAQNIDSLASEVRAHAAALAQWIQRDSSNLDWEHDGILNLDHVGIRFLGELGPPGQAAAASEFDIARKRWRQHMQTASSPTAPYAWWSPGKDAQPPIIWKLAEVLLRRRLEAFGSANPNPVHVASPVKAKTKKAVKHPAISVTVLRRVIDALFAKGLTTKVLGAETWLLNRFGVQVALLAPEIASDVARAESLLTAANSLIGHRLFRYLVSEGVEAGRDHGHDKYGVIVVAGGLSRLAYLLDVRGSKAATQLGSVLDAFKLFKLPLPDGATASLLSWSLTRTSQGSPAQLRIVLHDALLPDYVNGLPKTTTRMRQARKLVSLPWHVTPLTGHVRSHASQALLQLLLLEELRLLGEELATTGGARIPWERWQELAREAGLSPEMVPAVMENLVGSDQPFLDRDPADPERFTLAEGHGGELKVIVQGGEMSASGRKRQALSAKKSKKY